MLLKNVETAQGGNESARRQFENIKGKSREQSYVQERRGRIPEEN